MAFPYVPVALGAGALVLVLALAGTAGAATKPSAKPLPPPPPPVRPRRPANPPPGSGSALVAPACEGLTGDAFTRCSAGLLVHSTPDTSVASRLAQEDTSPTSPHALTGDEVAVLEVNVADRSTPPTTRIWWKVMTPVGTVGYVSAVDPQGRSNFRNVTPPGGQARLEPAPPGPSPLPPPPLPAFARGNVMPGFATSPADWRRLYEEARARGGVPVTSGDQAQRTTMSPSRRPSYQPPNAVVSPYGTRQMLPYAVRTATYQMRPSYAAYTRAADPRIRHFATQTPGATYYGVASRSPYVR